ncbi:MAG: nucleotidyltransferase family protein [Anaeroplasmataceae bacterium]
MNNLYLVDMLKAYLKEKNLILNVSIDKAIEDAKAQSLQPFLYLVYKNKEFKQYYITSSIIQERFIQAQDILSNILSENKIRHIFLKGSILCKLYPDIALRTRGDIDIYIDDSDITKVRNILTNIGFIEQDICEHHIGYMKDGIEIEVHFRLITELGFKVMDYYKDPFKLSNKITDYKYELTHEEHFIFVFLHFLKHLYGGAGLRFLLDFYYMFKKWDLDIDYIYQKIEELGYKKAYNNLLNSLYYLSNEIFDPKMEEIDIKFMIDYLLDSGIHGFNENHERDNAYNPNKDNKFKFFIYKVFLTNKGYRIAKYPKLGKHMVFYPILLIYNIIRLFINAIKKLFMKIFHIKPKTYNLEQSNERTELNKKLGIQ